jgi:hypothetical protein
MAASKSATIFDIAITPFFPINFKMVSAPEKTTNTIARFSTRDSMAGTTP